MSKVVFLPKQTVTVFEDPITQTKPEGYARLIKKEYATNDDLECWTVKFPDDDYTVLRMLLNKQEETK